MNNITVVRYKTRLDHLFSKIEAFQDDLELQAQWARYLCVLVAGLLETSIRAIYSKYARDCSAPNIANYVTRRLDSFTNANMTKIISLVSSFNPEWGSDLENQTQGETKNAIDSICANRHLISHGRDSGVSYVRLKNWYREAVKLVDMLETQCNSSHH